jgi:hypothetical protein
MSHHATASHTTLSQAVEVPCAPASSDDLAHLLRTATDLVAPARTNRLALDPDNLRQGLGQLVLTLVKLLHELLERQAIRRIEGGGLTDKQIEALGDTLMRQAQEIERLRGEFGLSDKDLNIDLGPIGRLF